MEKVFPDNSMATIDTSINADLVKGAVVTSDEIRKILTVIFPSGKSGRSLCEQHLGCLFGGSLGELKSSEAVGLQNHGQIVGGEGAGAGFKSADC